jgi:hypothetical protein
MFVDNRARSVYGQRYVDDYEGGDAVSGLVTDVMATIRAVHRREAEISARRGALPPAAETLRKIRAAITSKVGNQPPIRPSGSSS